MVQCPRCGVEASELHKLDPVLIQKLQDAGEAPPVEVCNPCRSELHKSVQSHSGGVLVQQERAAEQHRLHLWKSRVLLIRRARSLMSQKNYSEAAANYEKYLKILEIVFQCKKGSYLTPEMFKDNARTSELTVVASVYWDLLRIYDSSDRYGDRQAIAARQLASFIRFTPIFPDIIKKAQAFAKQAKHPEVIRAFLKGASLTRPRCFVATSAFLTPMAPEVQILRFYRDEYLQKSEIGRKFVQVYYRVSPLFAKFLDRNSSLKPLVRGFLRLLIKCVGAL